MTDPRPTHEGFNDLGDLELGSEGLLGDVNISRITPELNNQTT